MKALKKKPSADQHVERIVARGQKLSELTRRYANGMGSVSEILDQNRLTLRSQ